MKSIGIVKELQKLGICIYLIKEDVESLKRRKELLHHQGSGHHTGLSDTGEESSDVGVSPEKDARKRIKSDALSGYELLNVDVPENREKFLTEMLKALNPEEHQGKQKKVKKSKQEELDHRYLGQEREKKNHGKALANVIRKSFNASIASLNSSQTNNPQRPNEEEDSIAESSDNELEEQLRSLRMTQPGQKKQTTVNERETTFYYYKRWIWMQFVWASISIKDRYSQIIKKSFSSPTQYVSVKEEGEYTKSKSTSSSSSLT